MPGVVNDLLTAYDPRMAGELHAKVFRDLALWSLANCTCEAAPEHHAAQSYVAATFCVFCLPPGASFREAMMAAKCCLLFFLVDDGGARRLSGFVDFLETGDQYPADEPAQCLSSLLGGLAAHGCDAGGFRADVRRWAISMAAEQVLDPVSVAYEDYYALRKNTIFVSCLISCWAALLHIDLPGHHSSSRAEVVDLATRTVIIANDLGSINVDRATPGGDEALVEVNSVLSRSRTLGSRDRAVLEAVVQYNSYVREFREKERRPQAGPEPHDPSLSRFLTVVRCVVNGNLAGTRHLVAERYEGSSEELSKLNFI
jgi:hypothetical protein